jgi:beta-lactamase class D
MFRFFLVLIILSVSVFPEDQEISKLFTDKGISGTIVIASLDGKTKYIHNDTRSQKRILPASTFKIPNTLIALEESVVKTDSQVIAWDGVKRELPEWNKNQTLKTAFQYSCVWVYQYFAGRIGINKYRYYLEKLNYGNKHIDTNVTTFWLEGNFGISAQEQVGLLRKLVLGNLPFAKSNLDILKKIMIVEETNDYILRAKTGWTARVTPQYGWYVGYLETKKATWLFATNINIKNQQDLVFRKDLTMAALKAKKIIQ